MVRARTILLFALPLIWACSDQTTGSAGGNNSNGDLRLQDAYSADSSTNDTSLDIEVDVCENVNSKTDPKWCFCVPECCQSQQWFCPPSISDPTHYKKEVIVDICDDNNVPCIYGDPGCPPPEVLYVGECEEAYECPPTSNTLDYGWQWCEMPDGSVGKQKIQCSKGKLYKSPCQGCIPEICDGIDNDCDDDIDEDVNILFECSNDCGPGIGICIAGEEFCIGMEPEEEICDGIDNDCDGETDEDQLNDCGTCGLVPEEICNNYDDDCDGEIDEALDQACYTECGAGVEMCIFGNWVGCTAQLPQSEICDGIDNDCDGEIDEGIDCLCSIQDVGTLVPCTEMPLMCGQGYKTCECLDDDCKELGMTECLAMCHWMTSPPGMDFTCDPTVGMPLEQEVCNNFDDNCNDQIDENLNSTCYTGPAGTVLIGECVPGEIFCQAGEWGNLDGNQNFIPGYCKDEITPEEEICDGKDNDCDGESDWGKEIPDTDILLIVDWSSSMSQEVSAVLVALTQFMANYSDQESVQWGLIIGPHSEDYFGTQQSLRLISNITTFEDFLSNFGVISSLDMSGGSHEMLLDALYLALHNITTNPGIPPEDFEWAENVGSDPPKDEFIISWRENADRIIILFTDEQEQSFFIPEITVSDVINSCTGAPQTKVYTFTNKTFWKWDELSDACQGKNFKLSMQSFVVHSNLLEILDEMCE